MKAFRTLCRNEIRLSIRDMNMLIFAIGMPLAVLIVLGIIYGNKLAFSGASYTFLEQSMGALSTIAICAGGLMGLPIVISECREKKVLKRFKVTPVSPVLLLLVYLMLYILYATVSLIVLFLVAGLCWNIHMSGSWLAFLGSWFLTMISTLSIGMMVGGIAKNTKSAGVIATILYFPMLIFSGTTLPFEVMPKGMQTVIQYLPMTQGIQLMKATSLGLPVTNVWLPIVSMTGLTALCTFLSIRFFKWE